MENINNKIRNSIASGKTEEAIRELVSQKDQFEQRERKQIEIIAGRFYQWKNNSIQGINENDIELRKVESAILEIVSIQHITKSAAGKNLTLLKGKVGLIAIGMLFVIFAIYKITDKSSNQTSPFQTIGRDNITAGGNVTINNIENRKNEGELEITDIGFTNDAEFDVKMRNLGDIAIIINKIEITKLTKPLMNIYPMLRPSARYIIPIDDIKVGDSKSLSVSHYIDANKADRILIATQSTTVYNLKVTFYYNKNKSVSFIKETW